MGLGPKQFLYIVEFCVLLMNCKYCFSVKEATNEKEEKRGQKIKGIG